MTTEPPKKSYRTLIEVERLEPYLKFPSGLTIKQAKQNAKALKKAQNISQTEAMKIVCWGNGLIDVKDYSQSIDKLVSNTFGRSSKSFGFIKKAEQIQGVWWYKNDDDTENYESIVTSTTSLSRYNEDKEANHFITSLVEHLNNENEQENKQARFLQAVRDCITFLGHDFYRIYGGKSLAGIESIHDLDINVEKLLFDGSGSGGSVLMSYALASCYNTSYTARLLMQEALEIKFKNDEQGQFDISNKEDRESLASCVNDYQEFGSMCYNLDKSNKDIIKRLLDNYHGW